MNFEFFKIYEALSKPCSSTGYSDMGSIIIEQSSIAAEFYVSFFTIPLRNFFMMVCLCKGPGGIISKLCPCRNPQLIRSQTTLNPKSYATKHLGP